eukprot:TRINITY_DN5546_c0_g1_i1.p1 TRINITY_DN5546_c0_g1~~TRINITY_DN5546_c0_g1_i1.p1  ORF type:complete len:247 (+),score=48.91 TRINITY_DN5546_c0_g1_i1:72-743(+)
MNENILNINNSITDIDQQISILKDKKRTLEIEKKKEYQILMNIIFSYFPDEIYYLIIKFIKSPHAIIQMSMVNKKFFNLCTGNQLWIELFCDNFTNIISPSELRSSFELRNILYITSIEAEKPFDVYSIEKNVISNSKNYYDMKNIYKRLFRERYKNILSKRKTTTTTTTTTKKSDKEFPLNHIDKDLLVITWNNPRSVNFPRLGKHYRMSFHLINNLGHVLH